MPIPDTTTQQLAGGLARVLDEVRHVECTGVHDLTTLSGGASRQTWSFRACYADGTDERLILQRGGLGDAGDLPGADEASVLRAVAAAGVPVPPVVAASIDGHGALSEGDENQRWVISEFVPGETIGPRILRHDEFAGTRELLVDQLATTLARLHRIDPDTIEGLAAFDPIVKYRDLLAASGEPHPAFELALAWLDAHPPPRRPPALVHGDFRMGNLIVDDDGLRAVIDWELPHRGNPVEDLGWLCVRAWRFGADLPVAGVGTRAELLAAYRGAGGADIDRDELRWWEIAGTFRWGVICILQAARHLRGGERSVELAAIGRRICETEWDLCNLLRPDIVASLPEPATDPTPGFADAPHDAPGMADMLGAVGEFLDGTVREHLYPPAAFQARVASNLLGIAARQWDLGAGHAAAHTRRLEALGVADDAGLVAAIRRAEDPFGWDTAWRAVAADVRDKLLVANPRYLAAPAN